ncbi:MAG: YCF48-related protein [Bacteroidota bacterium]|nr:YCF48-related protein [Bacteroidota bacterium]
MMKNHLLCITLACSLFISVQAQTKVNAGDDPVITCGSSYQLRTELSWIPLSSGTKKNLRSVFFIDKNTGFAIGDSCIIIKTTDAGATWVQKKPATISTEYLNSICFINKDTGYIVGSQSIIKTTDGGETWLHKAGIGGNAIYMTPKGTGFVGGEGLFSVIDGNSMSVSPANNSSEINSISFITSQIGYFVGDNSNLMKTSDGGITWNQAPFNINILSDNYKSVHFSDVNNGYVVGENQILRTFNGGENWSVMQGSSGNSVFFTPDSVAFICDNKGHVNKFRDVQQSMGQWSFTNFYGTLQTLPGVKFMNSVFFADANTGYAVGQSGQIYKLIGDGSYSWTPSYGLSETSVAEPKISPLTTTTYHVTYTTPKGDSSTDSVTVNVNSEVVNAGADQTICCGETAQLLVTTNYTGTGKLKYQWTPSSGLSNDTIANPVATINDNTTYTVAVTTPNGCTSSDDVKVSLASMNKPDLGIVTVNSSNNNIIAWARPSATTIDSIFIYKEKNITDVYKKIGSVAYAAPNQFVDTLSDGKVQSNKYRISLKDHCGFESAASNPHKTMHLSISQGMNNIWNLIWEPYSGINVLTYNIYRGTSSGDLSLINSTSGSNTQFTDYTAPSGIVYYLIEVISPTSIFVDKLSPTQKAAGLYQSISANTFPVLYYSSRSNVATTKITGIETTATSEMHAVYPNPAKDNIKITTTGQSVKGMSVIIYNATGCVVKSGVLINENQSYDISSLCNGIYMLEIKTGNFIGKQRLIVDK